jgi:hypothetical protein
MEEGSWTRNREGSLKMKEVEEDDQRQVGHTEI